VGEEECFRLSTSGEGNVRGNMSKGEMFYTHYKYCWKLKMHQSQLWSVWRRLIIENAIIALCVLTSAVKEQFWIF